MLLNLNECHMAFFLCENTVYVTPVSQVELNRISNRL